MFPDPCPLLQREQLSSRLRRFVGVLSMSTDQSETTSPHSNDAVGSDQPVEYKHFRKNALAIDYRSIADLKEIDRNPRKHPKRQITSLVASIREFGFNVPLLIDESDQLITGHACLEAARQLGMEEVPVVCITHLSDAQIKAFRIAHNRLAELSDWDQEELAFELREIETLIPNLEFETLGFEIPEIDLIFGNTVDPSDVEPEVIPSVEDGPPISALGDLWILGNHRILCGDARVPSCIDRLMDQSSAAMVFSDPPYNVAIPGHVSGKGKHQHANFAMASGEMSPTEFEDFLSVTVSAMAENVHHSGLLYLCMDWRHIEDLLRVGRRLELTLLNICVWKKSNGGMGSLYRSQHELIAVFRKGIGSHVNNVKLGRYGRNRTNVWDYPGVSSFGGDRADALAMHPTVKPTQMIADAILDCTDRHDIVLDTFGGSGSTLMAADQTERRARLIEIDPRYVDLTIRRWQEKTDLKARHADTDMCFDDGPPDQPPPNEVTSPTSMDPLPLVRAANCLVPDTQCAKVRIDMNPPLTQDRGRAD